MTRRVSLPGADELFRSTVSPQPVHESESAKQEFPPESPVEPQIAEALPEGDVFLASPGAPVVQDAVSTRARQEPRPKHGEKVTFYCTDDELTRLERARLALRAEHRLACDRGRLVRAALAQVLEEFEAHGDRSALVRRLRRQ